jgi:hypothetical protein
VERGGVDGVDAQFHGRGVVGAERFAGQHAQRADHRPGHLAPPLGEAQFLGDGEGAGEVGGGGHGEARGEVRGELLLFRGGRRRAQRCVFLMRIAR